MATIIAKLPTEKTTEKMNARKKKKQVAYKRGPLLRKVVTNGIGGINALPS